MYVDHDGEGDVKGDKEGSDWVECDHMMMNLMRKKTSGKRKLIKQVRQGGREK